MYKPASRFAMISAAMLGCSDDSAAVEDPSSAILQRPSRPDYECFVAQELKDLKPRQWGAAGHAMAQAADGYAWLARVEWMSSNVFQEGDSKLLVSEVDGSGAFGANTVVPVENPALARFPVLVSLDEGAHALIWTQGSEGHRHLAFTTINAGGDIAIAPKRIIDSVYVDEIQARAARASSSEVGLVWNGIKTSASDADAGDRGVFFVSISEQGERVGEPIQVASNTGYVQPVIAPAVEGGFALLWKATTGANADAPAEVFFARVDVAGEPQGAPVRLTELRQGAFGASFGSDSLAILATDHGYLVGWTEGSYGNSEDDHKGAHSIVRLLRVNPSGHALAPPADLRSMQDHVDEVEPTLFEFDDAVGVLWSRGKHIDTCSGCVPDHSQEFVLLDPIALHPVSNVVTLPPPARGGLLRRSAAVVDSGVFTAIDISFHVHSEPGFAAYNCDKR